MNYVEILEKNVLNSILEMSKSFNPAIDKGCCEDENAADEFLEHFDCSNSTIELPNIEIVQQEKVNIAQPCPVMLCKNDEEIKLIKQLNLIWCLFYYRRLQKKEFIWVNIKLQIIDMINNFRLLLLKNEDNIYYKKLYIHIKENLVLEHELTKQFEEDFNIFAKESDSYKFYKKLKTKIKQYKTQRQYNFNKQLPTLKKQRCI
jgi:hypothetical protein